MQLKIPADYTSKYEHQWPQLSLVDEQPASTNSHDLHTPICVDPGFLFSRTLTLEEVAALQSARDPPISRCGKPP